MTLRGRFGNTSGRPYFQATIAIPSLRIGGPISFLLDTGSDITVLMPTDAKRFNLDYGLISKRADSYGVGGKSCDYVVEAIVSISDPGIMAYGWLIDLRVMAPNPAIAQAPSLLGRDILKHWKLHYEPSTSVLEAEVKFSDGRKDLRTPPPIP